MDKIAEFFNGLFGTAGKWVMLGCLGVLVILGIVLFSFVVANIKWILLGASVILVIVGVGLFLYKKFM